MKKDYWVILSEKESIENKAELLMPSGSELGSYYKVELGYFFNSESEAQEALAKHIERRAEHYENVRKPGSKYHPDHLKSSEQSLAEAKKSRIKKISMTLSFEAD